MPRAIQRPLADLNAEERAVLTAALEAAEQGWRYSASLCPTGTSEDRARRLALFRQATVAANLIDRLLL